VSDAYVPNPITLSQPIERLELIRVLAPLAILGFLSSRLVGVEHWLTEVGFVVPEHPFGDWRQPIYIPPLPVWLAVLVALATVASAIAMSVGYRTRLASGSFAALLAYFALADRLETFTVNKLGTIVAIALFASPAGARYGIDALRAEKAGGPPPPTHVSWGNVRFFQALVVFMYCGSGLAKLQGGWLTDPNVIWSHLHDSYQTAVTYFAARHVPTPAWSVFQYVTLLYEVGAPLWYGLQRTRVPALIVGLGMHATIGLMFGPVIWFSLLMSVLIVACFAPLPRLTALLQKIVPDRSSAATREQLAA